MTSTGDAERDEVRARIAADPVKAAKMRQAQATNAANAKSILGKHAGKAATVDKRSASEIAKDKPKAAAAPNGVKVPKDLAGKKVHVLCEIKWRGPVPKDWQDFQKYEHGVSVEENLANGITLDGLEWDLDVGLIDVR